VVVGGGISGLAAAWYLVRTHSEIEVTLLEAAPHVGGKLSVSDLAGIAVDEGAESFVASRPEALRLAREVGLESDLVTPAVFQASVFSRGRIRAMPRGQFMGIPTDLRSLAASEVLSPAGLLRVPLDRVISPTPMGQDVSVGEFISARVGREVVDRLVEPLLGGVYAGRADALSMQATMPALFRELRHDRSLLAATRRVAGGGMEAAGARRGLPFRGIIGGVGRVPGAMAAALVGSGVQIRTRTTVRGLTATETGWDVEVGPASSPEVIHADGVIVATPAAPAARLLADVVPNVALELSGIEAASVAVIALAYRSADFRAHTTGSGLLIPPVEGRMVKAVTYLDQKWGWLNEAAEREGVRLLRVSGNLGWMVHGPRAEAAATYRPTVPPLAEARRTPTIPHGSSALPPWIPTNAACLPAARAARCSAALVTSDTRGSAESSRSRRARFEKKSRRRTDDGTKGLVERTQVALVR